MPHLKVMFVGAELQVTLDGERTIAKTASPTDDVSIAAAVMAIADEFGLEGEDRIDLATRASAAGLLASEPCRLLVFRMERPQRGIRLSVQVSFAGEPVLRDLVDIRELRARERLAKEVASRVPALQGREPEVLARLDREVEFFSYLEPAGVLPAREEAAAPEVPAQGRGIDFVVPVAWTEPVDGAEVLDELTELLRRHVVLPRQGAEIVALWIAHAHALDASDVSPRLVLASPERRCGKSTLLTLIRALTPRAVFTSHVSVAALFRMIAAHQPTVLLDEGDAFIKHNEDIRAMLNAGHRRDGCVIRCVGDGNEPRSFPVFAATAIAAIGRLPATIEDRAIILRMKRRMPNEKVTRLVLHQLPGAIEGLVRRIARWVSDHLETLKSADPEVPPELNDRAADGWRPLLAIADAAGPRWAGLARAASRELAREDGLQDEASTKILLLRSVRAIFQDRGVDRIASEDLVDALLAIEDGPWSGWKHGTGITQNILARMLGEFGIRSKTVRLAPGDRRKGYERAGFLDAWERYLVNQDGDPEEEAGEGSSKRDTVTSQETGGLQRHGLDEAIRDAGVPTELPARPSTGPTEASRIEAGQGVTLEPSNGAGCHGVTDRPPPTGGPPCSCNGEVHVWDSDHGLGPGPWRCWSCQLVAHGPAVGGVVP